MFEIKAYGDAINVGSRLEGANKVFGTRILISESLARNAASFHGRPVGDLILRGRSDSVRAFELLKANRKSDSVVENYHRAFELLAADDPRAIAAFAAHVGKYPTDQLASFHLKRLLGGALGTRIVVKS